MKTFHVYLHPARGYEAVPEGPCLPALCFSVFWLFFRGLALPAVLVLIGATLIMGAEATAGRHVADEVQSWAFRLLVIAAVLALWLLPFLYGNRWRHADLLRRGFAQVACLRALSGDDAVARALSLDTVTSSLHEVSPASPVAPAAEVRRSHDRRSRPGGLDSKGRGPRYGADSAGDPLLAAR